MEILRDLRGHFTFATLALALLLIFSTLPQDEPRTYSQLAQAAQAMPGEATDSCVALSRTSMVAGHPREVGEYCIVAASVGSDKLTCIPDDTMPPGFCKVHYCDPTGCHDTSTSLPSDILNIQKGIDDGVITPDTSFNTTQIETPTDIQTTDVNGYTETSVPSSPTSVSPSSEGLPGPDQFGSAQTSNSDSLLFSQDAPAPTSEQFSQSSSFSQDSSIYQNVSAPAENTTAIDPVNTEGTTFAPNSVNVDAPSAESTFSNPSTAGATQQAEAQPSFLESAANQVNVYVKDVRSFFGFPTTPANPCPEGVCTNIGVRG